ncbi:MAG: sterol desaturase family protein [Acidimicrobiales bacterium]
MMALRPPDPGIAVAAGIDSLPSARAVFFRFWSPRLLAIGLCAAVVARVMVGVALTGWDLMALLIVAVLIPVVEWTIHLVVLHARPRRIAGLLIDPGAGHRQHHLNPSSVSWVLLRGPDAALFQVINAALVVVVVGGPLGLLGAQPLGPVLTGVVAALSALLHYEWAHFLFHTAYRPRTRHYRRLKSNHRLHHWRNERYWLGITSNAADRLLGTYPATRAAVPLSSTARDLGIDASDL